MTVALQAALLRAAGEFGGDATIEAQRSRLLATAAGLDYVLMLATGTAGVRIPARDAERAMREGITRAVDDLILAAGAIAEIGTPASASFAREIAKPLREILQAEELASDERTFAVIALANA